MKTFRELTAAVLLTCVLAVSVSAGEIHAGFHDPAPPPSPTDVVTEETGDTETENDLTDLIVTLLNGVLSIL